MLIYTEILAFTGAGISKQSNRIFASTWFYKDTKIEITILVFSEIYLNSSVF